MSHFQSFLVRVVARTGMVVVLPAALAAQAATGVVAGRVTANGEPLLAATVVAAGTGRGTQTRADGSYRLTLPVGRYGLRARASASRRAGIP